MKEKIKNINFNLNSNNYCLNITFIILIKLFRCTEYMLLYD